MMARFIITTTKRRKVGRRNAVLKRKKQHPRKKGHMTVLGILKYYGLNITVSGPLNEKVYSQSIPAGTEVPRGTAVEVSFRSMEGDENPNY